MPSDSHLPSDSPAWDDPDYCPFCGAALTDGGAGFMDHVEDSDACADRFESWLDPVREDMDGEWGG